MQDYKPRLLIIDDDFKLIQLLDKFLKEQGFNPTTACNAMEAMAKLKLEIFNLIIMDVMMPQESGLELTSKIRNSENINKQTPIIMLTALGDVNERIKGLTVGADDYLAKPFNPQELVLRIQKILARIANTNVKEIFRFGNLYYDNKQHALYDMQKNKIHLTSAELQLLQILLKKTRNPISRFYLADKLGLSLSPRTIDVQITRLRKKIENNPKKPEYIRTIRHKGYSLWPD